jgi:hypothetical protein
MMGKVRHWTCTSSRVSGGVADVGEDAIGRGDLHQFSPEEGRKLLKIRDFIWLLDLIFGIEEIRNFDLN